MAAETALKDRTGILNRASDGSEQFQLHTPVPPLDLRLFAEIAPQKVRLGATTPTPLMMDDQANPN